MARFGRKRKLNTTRDSQGDPRRQLPGIHPETIAFRLRDLDRAGIRPRSPWDALDPLAGFTLGLLLMRYRACPTDPSSINEQQYAAGHKWAKLVRRHAAVMGYSLRSVPSLSLLLLPRGLTCAYQPDTAEIERIKSLWSDCCRALTHASRPRELAVRHINTHEFAVRDIVHAVCIENRGIESLTPADCANLRVGLKALGRILGPTARHGRARLRAWGRGESPA